MTALICTPHTDWAGWGHGHRRTDGGRRRHLWSIRSTMTGRICTRTLHTDAAERGPRCRRREIRWRAPLCGLLRLTDGGDRP
eukprot:9430828-Alexandrium_andersonii.AAC.1